MDNIICIAGPTASGKTALAVELAKEFVPCLFQRKGMIVFAFAELRGSFAAAPVFLYMGKECIVCSGNSLRDVLNSLTA